MYSPAWPHGNIQAIFDNVYLVMGTNITNYNNIELQHSRNMIIIRQDNELSLINTVRLSEEGLKQLDDLGVVNNVIRIGAFHGRDDAFYLDRYHAKLWALKGMKHANDRVTDVELSPTSLMPFPAAFFCFDTSVHPEGAIILPQDNGILITCDSIKNWVSPDEYFSSTTAKLYHEQDFFGYGRISSVWKEATQTKVSDFQRLMAFDFHHLLSAHGEPLMHNAYNIISEEVKKVYGV